ncbi:MAG TPA: DinB family protein [Blastococcus sp.]|nr:DinB family protein [Blastococcus sp.]
MRTEPPNTGPETSQLPAYLDYQRETMLLKIEGLTREQLARTLAPSSLTLGGLLNHLALVEDSWFRERFAGLPADESWAGVDWDADPDWEFRTAAELEPEELRERYRQACARSREVVAQATGLDQLSAAPRRNGRHFDLRWMLLHMIEETARHAGHADLLRESIDGSTGE